MFDHTEYPKDTCCLNDQVRVIRPCSSNSTYTQTTKVMEVQHNEVGPLSTVLSSTISLILPVATGVVLSHTRVCCAGVSVLVSVDVRTVIHQALGTTT